MHSTNLRTSLFLILLSTSVLFSSVSKADGVVVSNAVIRLLPGNLPAAGYFTLSNKSDEAIILVGAKVDLFGHVLMHQSRETDGMAHMEEISEIVLEPGADIEFKPRSYHLMLMERANPIVIGDTVPVDLLFKSSNDIKVSFKTVSPTEVLD